MRKRVAIASVVAVGVSAAACSLLVPLDDTQCTTNDDCAARGAAFTGAVCVDHVCQPSSTQGEGGADAGADVGDAAPDTAIDPWRCLNQPPQTVHSDASIGLELHVLDALRSIVTAGVNGGSDLTLLSGTPLAGVTVRGCDTFDPTCSGPILDAAVTDEAGIVSFDVNGGFAGYFEMSRSDLFPSTVFPGRVLNGVTEDSLIFPQLSVFATQQIAQTLQVPLATDQDGGLGHAFFLVYDCDDRHAPGVSFSLGDAGTPDGSVFFYQRGQFPDQKATQTDTLGTGGVINYPAGFAVMTATEVATGRVLGTITTIIRPGGMSFTWIRARTR
jgi:hypothetical protein